MEEALVQSLESVGYDGLLLDTGKLNQALDDGAKSMNFTALVSWLAKELALFGNLEENVHPTASPDDSNTFLLELSLFLKELGCENSQLTSGNINKRLATKQERVLLLEFLVTELMASKINYKNNPNTGKIRLTIYESDTAKALKDMLIALQVNKPPDNITIDQLFKKLEEKLKTVVSSAPSDLLGKSLIMGELSNSQWEKIDELQKDMAEEYRIRRELLLKRLDVTIQSFLWSDRIKKKEDQVNDCYYEKRKLLTTEPNVTISQLLAARDDVAIIEKTSSASVRKNTRSDVTKVIIGDVPDRGGRANEQAPPPPEMPSWQKDRVQGPGGGGRGGRGGRGGGEGGRGGRGGGEGGRGGRGGGGGGRGGYNKDTSTNFGQNRDWQNSSQNTGASYQDNKAGNYQGGGYQRGGGNSSGGGGAFYQDNRSGGSSGYQDNKGGGYQDNRGGGYQDNRSGGYQDNRSGGYQDNRSGGYQDNRGGGYQDNRSGGYQDNRGGGSQDNRGGGYQDNRGGGYQDNRSGGYQDNRGGGYQDNRNSGDYQQGGGGRDNNSGYNRGRGGRVQSGWSQGGGGGGGGYNRGGNRSHY